MWSNRQNLQVQQQSEGFCMHRLHREERVWNASIHAVYRESHEHAAYACVEKCTRESASFLNNFSKTGKLLAEVSKIVSWIFSSNINRLFESFRSSSSWMIIRAGRENFLISPEESYYFIYFSRSSHSKVGAQFSETERKRWNENSKKKTRSTSSEFTSCEVIFPLKYCCESLQRHAKVIPPLDQSKCVLWSVKQRGIARKIKITERISCSVWLPVLSH